MESAAIVTAADPLKLVPLSPSPIVNAFVVVEVIVPDDPRATVTPLNVTELLVSFPLAILPASIAFVTVPVSPVVTTVPDVAGRVIVVVPAIATGWSSTVPELEPGRVTDEIPASARLPDPRLSVIDVVPMKVVSDVRAIVPELSGIVRVRVVLALIPESWNCNLFVGVVSSIKNVVESCRLLFVSV